MFFDTHCHLDFPNFAADRDQVLATATAAGVTQILNPGCDLASSERATALALRQPQVWAAVGIHPHSANEATPEALAELKKLANLPKVVAIGEIGLDFFKSETSSVDQKEAFLRQLVLAEELGRPAIIHSRAAETETLAILEKFPKLAGVFHCFGGGVAFAEAVLAKGFYLGFTGIITFAKAENLRAVVAMAPLDRILIETDAPFLAPEPRRGSRCSPADVATVAAKIAEIKNLSVAEVAKITTANAKRLFLI